MRSGMVMAMAAVMVVAGCATVRDSRVNPFNWFGSARATAGAPASEGAALTSRPDGRVLVAQVSALHLERSSGGAILRAVGLPATQGWYQAGLTLSPESTDETLVYDFVLTAPVAVNRAGSAPSREIQVATFFSDMALERIRSVTVRGATNGLTTRR
ncbi:hypothetical protein [Falsigemmobacter faecalis]|uniref:Lipoprotein n=1 Tax=Falsigemmobacter faecalis TaxID=2488730 RepID=A0A3P3DR96_9RHOB|nr:hypothetical protein [Falsigemmobacter faecalis]RRH75168.1 hypothetical protein EG244_09295 [Falsigemmobacter faecalis]